MRKWSTKNADADGKPLEHAFNLFMLDPIFKVFNAIMKHKKDQVETICEKLEIKLTPEEKDIAEAKALLKTVMHKFLPASKALLEMIVIHLPSPTTVQRYCVEILYEGPMDNESAIGICDCNLKRPLILYISKMVLTSDKCHFYAFSCVFSGTVHVGHKIHIQGPNY